MTNDHNTDNQRQPRQDSKGASRDEHLGQKAHEHKASTGHDTMIDTRKQEKEGKGKVATSAPGGSTPDSNQD